MPQPPDSTTELRIHTLGPPRLTWGGRSIGVPRRQARALLFRLAAHLEPVPREQLCFLFWPDKPETSARRNLSRLLFHVQSALPLSGVVTTAPDFVTLDPQHVWSDAATFERLCNTSQLRQSIESLHKAVELFRGRFLEGFSLPDNAEFEMWSTLEAQSFTRSYLHALSELVEENVRIGDHETAIGFAQRYLAVDELAEEMHRWLMTCYLALGDRSAALQQFQQCAAILKRELDVSPAAATQAIYQSALQNDLHPAVSASPASRWTTLPSQEVPLVGRQDALRGLVQALTRARSGQGSMVLITGESGIGKSRLVQDFAANSAGRSLVLVGLGQPSGKALPYYLIVEALRYGIAGRRAPLNVSPPWLAEASRLLPELRDIYPDLPPPMPGHASEARARLFEALFRTILGLSEGPYPVILILDDLHWADGTTLAWLTYVGAHLRDTGLLIVGTCHSEELQAVDAHCRSLKRLQVLTELTLDGLDIADVRHLLSHLLESGHEHEGLAQQLFQVTAGNPFFLLETLRAIIESGPLPGNPADLANLPLPDTVREATQLRLARLSPVARQVLEAGAVLGARFDFGLARHTVGRDELESVDGLDELVDRHLLIEQADAYQFHHEIIRTVVYNGLGVWRRRILHRRAAEALQTSGIGDAATLAHHFEHAEQHTEAAEFALQAGEMARAVFDYTVARFQFDRALALLDRASEQLDDAADVAANHRLRLRALNGRGWVFSLLGDMAAFERDTQEIARLTELLHDRNALARLRWREAYANRWYCRYADALRAAREGVSLAQSAEEPILEAMCLREVGVTAREAGTYSQAETALEAALDLFTELNDVVFQIHTLGDLSTLHVYTEEYEAAMDWARRALAKCEQAGLDLERRLPLGHMGAVAAALGDSDHAREYLQQSLTVAKQIADRTQEVFCLGHLGWLSLDADQLTEAVEHLQAGLALAERIDSRTEQSWLHSGLAKAYWLDHDDERALAHAHRALELAQEYDRAHDVALARQTIIKLKGSNL